MNLNDIATQCKKSHRELKRPPRLTTPCTYTDNNIFIVEKSSVTYVCVQPCEFLQFQHFEITFDIGTRS